VNTTLSIQESLYPELTCFGCGHANPNGFHLRSYRQGDLIVAEFNPRPEHDNGFGFVNGGVIATVLDCHGAASVMWQVANLGQIRDSNRPQGNGNDESHLGSLPPPLSGAGSPPRHQTGLTPRAARPRMRLGSRRGSKASHR
jgi:hypothetical protein